MNDQQKEQCKKKETDPLLGHITLGKGPSDPVQEWYLRNTSESVQSVLGTVNIWICFKPHRTLLQDCRRGMVYCIVYIEVCKNRRELIRFWSKLIISYISEWLLGVWLRHFSTTCAVHIEDCEGWWLSGCCGSVAEHWQPKPEVSWVWLPVTAGFFTFLYFRLITSKFIY